MSSQYVPDTSYSNCSATCKLLPLPSINISPSSSARNQSFHEISVESSLGNLTTPLAGGEASSTRESQSQSPLTSSTFHAQVLPTPQCSSLRRLSRTRSSVQQGMQGADAAEAFGTIGVEYMRVTGKIPQFKGILNNLGCSAEGKVPRKQSAFEALQDLSHLHQSQIDDNVMCNNKYGHDDEDENYSRKETPKSKASKQSKQSFAMTTIPIPKLPRHALHAMNHKSSISYRLGRRKELFEKRRKICDYALVFSLLGIFMMIIENELTGASVYLKTSLYSLALKCFIVASTICLLIFTLIYHAVEVQIFMIDNSVEDWRIALIPRRVVQVLLELLASAVCPIPGVFYFTWTTVHADGVTVTATKVPVDVLLSIPMFLRLYLICRVMLLHSKLFTDTSSRSIGALNRISFNVRFVVKTLMTLCPGTVLLVFTVSFWVIASWVLRLCERHHTGPPVSADALKHTNYINSLWMIAITFLTVGYGDVVPNTDCGRGVAIITGIMGVGVSSLIVAVIASKLELTMAEKHVHNFMLDTQLSKRVKHAAANVLRETWLIFKYRRLVQKTNSAKIRYHQRKFLLAIYELRQVKAEQRKVNENSLTLADVAKVTSITHELVSDMNEWQADFSGRMTNLEEKISKLTDVVTVAFNLNGQNNTINRNRLHAAHFGFRPPAALLAQNAAQTATADIANSPTVDNSCYTNSINTSATYL